MYHQAPWFLGSWAPSPNTIRGILTPILRGLLVLTLVLSPELLSGQGAESNSPPPSLSLVETTNFQQVLRACQQIQEQLQATQLAVDQSRQEAKAGAAQNAEALIKGLQVLQETLVAERTREIEAAQSSNRAMLNLAGTLGGIGLLALLILAGLQWRTSKCLADLAAALPLAHGLGQASTLATLGPDAGHTVPSDPAAQSSSRLLSALDQLDNRIHELKRLVHSNGNGDPAAVSEPLPAATASDPARCTERTGIQALLKQAKSLTEQEDFPGALARLEEVLALDPDHTEALVKKGATLERLHRLNEAVECYDRAIALDGSMTTAYLHKGGLYNRLERFKEALQCYEKALRTHEQRVS
jgi:tetratricopeptide (TPR) repeat protein